MQTGPSSPLCRSDCGACCTAPSISSPIPGMPQGKAAGERCVQLDERQRCRIFGDPRRPAVCSGLQPSAEMCGSTREQAMSFLTRLEQLTAPTLSSLGGTGPASGSGGLPVSSKA